MGRVYFKKHGVHVLPHRIYVYPHWIGKLPRRESNLVDPYPIKDLVKAGKWELKERGLADLYVCHCCFEPFTNRSYYVQHMRTCIYPVGRVVYNDPDKHVRVHEIDALVGDKDVALVASQLAALMGCFVPSKGVCNGVAFFTFYALYNMEQGTPYFAGACSVQSVPYQWNAVHEQMDAISAFTILPPHRGKGYGTFLVELSRHLARHRGWTGVGVEHPLSEDGIRAHKKVWCRECLLAIEQLSGVVYDAPRQPQAQGKLPASDPNAPRVTLTAVAAKANLLLEDVVSTLAMYDILVPGPGGRPVLCITNAHRELLYGRRLFNPACVDALPIYVAIEKPDIFRTPDADIAEEEEEEEA